MKKIILLSFLVFALSGCAIWQRMTHHGVPSDSNAGIAPLSPYSGLKARITVGDFEIKAAKATAEIGSGLREMLVSASINSNRFCVIERQPPSAVMPEQESAGPGAAQQANVQQRDKAKVADLIITAAVTEFEPEFSGGRAGLGGGGGVGSGALGGLLGMSPNKAHLALEIRISDALTSEVVANTRLPGEASDIPGGFAAGFSGNWSLGSGLSAYANTPMEKAIRICIIEAVRYMAQAIPATYYKY